MTRKEFTRTTPESVGIPSSSVEWLLDELEYGGFTEPHSLIIMRHGKICAEGWWSPYAPGMRHALMSLTKTYAGTAVGIAITEGLVKLTDRLIDIFPEQAPEEPSEYHKLLTVKDVLCMGSGIERMPQQGVDWIRDFLACKIDHKPGTKFIYSTMCEMLAAIVRQVSGISTFEYLKPRLFDKLGIDAKNLRWVRMGDGNEFCSAGMQATTEDNLRLMKLYADGGVWEGERILSEEFVRLATTAQIDNTRDDMPAIPGSPEMPKGKHDGNSGYGFMMWMCKRPGAYRADGMAGQYTVVIPDMDMIVSITENAEGPMRVLDTLWQFLDKIPGSDPLPEDEVASGRLARRLKTLALPAEPYAPFGAKRESVCGVEWNVVSGNFSLGGFSFGPRAGKGISSFKFTFAEDVVTIDYIQDGKEYTAVAGIDGSRRWNKIGVNRVFVSACWANDNILRLTWRASEGLFTSRYDFVFSGTRCDVKPLGRPMRLPGAKEPEPIVAFMA